MSQQTLPLVGARGAPCFDGSNPRELPRFLRQVEELFRLCNVAADNEKKEAVIKYVSIDIEEQWTALSHYAQGTWAEFKNEILQQYPEIGSVKEGTLSRIEEIIGEYQGLGFEIGSRVPDYVRAFRVEANKLMGTNPVMSNHEAVKAFMRAFTPEAAHELSQRLQFKYLNRKLNPTAAGAAGQVRRNEDKYKLEEVFQEALEVVQDSSSSLYDSIYPREAESSNRRRNLEVSSRPAVAESPAIKQEQFAAKLDSTFAKFEDILKNQENKFYQSMQVVDQRLGNLERSVNMGQVTQPSVNAFQPSGQTRPPYVGSGSRNCYYCGEIGHQQPTCAVKDQHIREGKIRLDEVTRRLTFMDGTPIHRNLPGNNNKERVERYIASHPQLVQAITSTTSGNTTSTSTRGQYDRPPHLEEDQDERYMTYMSQAISDGIDEALKRRGF
jgi:hypothetical protein